MDKKVQFLRRASPTGALDNTVTDGIASTF